MRPYATLAEFLAEERDTLSRTAVTLIGAPSRPRGVIIRFEVTLNDGAPILRGEGRVLGYQAADDRGPSALTLRFTRLDAKSKAVVDEAAALRDGTGTPEPHEDPGGALRVPGPASHRGSRETEPPEDPLAATSMGMTMPPHVDGPPSSGETPVAISSGNLPLGEAEEVGSPGATAADALRRDALLDRLRVRAKGLSATDVASILTRPPPA
jgi:hypothetical protein